MDETLEQQIARLTQQVSDLTTINTDLTSQLGTSRGELRSTRHKATFKSVALEAGVKAKAIDSLYRLAGYDPGELDEADPVAVAALIEGARDEYDYCFEPAVVEPPAPLPLPAPVPVKPLQGLGRGKPVPVADKFRVTMADIADPVWLQKNKDAYSAAGRNGTLEIIDLT